MRPKKKISQTDIARELGISNVSVSNALAGRKGVSRDLSVKIREKAAHMGYCVGGTDADSLPDGLLLVLADRTEKDRAERLCRILREQQFSVSSCTASEFLDSAREGTPDPENCLGLVATEPLPAETLQALTKKSKKPVVGMGFFDCHVPMDFVMDDGFHGAQRMVQYLRGRGYDNIFYVRPEREESLTAAWRSAGIDAETTAWRGAGADAEMTAWRSAGIDAETAAWRGAGTDAEAARMRAEASAWDDRELGYRSEIYLETLNRGLTMNQAQPFDTEEEKNILTCREALAYIGRQGAQTRGREAGKETRTALFCGDMRTARALLRGLEKEGLRVPEDVAVAGYAAFGSDDLHTGERQITACENDEKKLLEKCCAVLRDRYRGRESAAKHHLVQGGIAEGNTA